MRRMPREVATACRYFAVCPDFLLLFRYERSYVVVSAVEFGFGEAKDIGSDRFHVVHCVEDVDAIF